MAEVTRTTELADRIEDYLSYLTWQWEGIPELAKEWDEWDRESKSVFELEWPIPEDRLHQLEQWATQGLLTPEQQSRFAELEALVAKNRPILEKLFREIEEIEEEDEE